MTPTEQLDVIIARRFGALTLQLSKVEAQRDAALADVQRLSQELQAMKSEAREAATSHG